MNPESQNMPPGWRFEVLSPTRERRACCIRVTTPEGRQVNFTHKPFQFACEITRELERELGSASGHPVQAAPCFRIARPEQLGSL